MQGDYELTDKGRRFIEKTMNDLIEDADKYEADPENYVPHPLRGMHLIVSNPLMRSYYIIMDGLLRDLTMREIYAQTPEKYYSTMDQAVEKATREGMIVGYTTDTSAFEKEFEDLF